MMGVNGIQQFVVIFALVWMFSEHCSVCVSNRFRTNTILKFSLNLIEIRINRTWFFIR